MHYFFGPTARWFQAGPPVSTGSHLYPRAVGSSPLGGCEEEVNFPTTCRRQNNGITKKGPGGQTYHRRSNSRGVWDSTILFGDWSNRKYGTTPFCHSKKGERQSIIILLLLLLLLFVFNPPRSLLLFSCLQKNAFNAKQNRSYIFLVKLDPTFVSICMCKIEKN